MTPLERRLRPYVLAGRRFRRRELGIVDLAYGRRTSFSQFGEDVLLDQFFGDQEIGFYVDVGAYDPFAASNTYLLYRRGWRGINLEPDPAAHARLSRGRPRDLNLMLAVSERPGSVPFLLDGSFSRIVDESELATGGTARPAFVDARPLAAILDEHLPAGQSIDLLDVDCEGHDLVVLQTNDWARHRPRVVLAEWHEGDAVPTFLVDQGYDLVVRLGLTGIFAAP